MSTSSKRDSDSAQLSDVQSVGVKKRNDDDDFILDTSSWESALQKDSSLANYKSDPLMLVLNKIENITDAFHAGFTCRRWFRHWEMSEKKNAKALEINLVQSVSINRNQLEKHKAYFLPNAGDFETETESLNKTKPQKYCKNTVRLDLSAVAPYENLKFLSRLPVTIEKLGQHFVNIRLLEMITPADYCLGPLFSSMSTSLPKLITLKMYPVNIKNLGILLKFWNSFAELQSPTLKHLTINRMADVGNLYDEHNYVKFYKEFHILNFPIFEQLTTFSLFVNEWIEDFWFNRDLKTLFSRLKPEGNARLGLELFVGYDRNEEVFVINKLSYLTFLKMKLTEYSYRADYLSKFYQYLPAMTNLQKIDLTICNNMNMLANYPSLLKIFSTLQRLEELSIDCHENFSYGFTAGKTHPKSELPQCKFVKVLSLVYCTANHADVVERFQLTNCFPKLQLVQCHFRQVKCIHCGSYNKADNLKVYQTCGQALAQGLIELNQIQKEIKFTFARNAYFDSLNSLMAGFKSTNQQS